MKERAIANRSIGLSRSMIIAGPSAQVDPAILSNLASIHSMASWRSEKVPGHMLIWFGPDLSRHLLELRSCPQFELRRDASLWLQRTASILLTLYRSLNAAN